MSSILVKVSLDLTIYNFSLNALRSIVAARSPVHVAQEGARDYI